MNILNVSFTLAALVILGLNSAETEKLVGVVVPVKVSDESAGSSNNVQKCSCDVQNKCVDGFKEHIKQCYYQCHDDEKYKPLTEKMDKSNVQECIDLRVKLFDSQIDCFYGKELQQQSCVKDENKKVQIEHFDSLKMVTDEVKNIAAKRVQTLSQKSGSKETVNSFLEIGNCARECLFDKLFTERCFDNQKCELDLNQELVQQQTKACLDKDEIENQAKEICECYKKAGINEMDSLCKLYQPAADQQEHKGRGQFTKVVIEEPEPEK